MKALKVAPPLIAGALAVATIPATGQDIPHSASSELTGMCVEWIATIAAVIAALATVALVWVAGVQLRKNRESQRLAFLAEYVSKIFTDKDISDTYHYLVYTYTNSKFREVREKLKELNEEENTSAPDKHKKMYKCLECLQDGREEGLRFYHPGMFQGSVEEERLDSLLGYFNIIAYYYNENIVSIKDINGIIGYHITVIASRDVIKEYMNYIEANWTKFEKRYGPQQPLHDLKTLLDKVQLERGVDPTPPDSKGGR